MSAAVFDERSAQRLQELGHLFRLPVVAEELGARLQQVGHDDALEIVLEVFEREQQSRHQRRVDRLRRASLLPPGKTFGTFRAERLPRPLMAKLRELSTGAFADRAVNVLASVAVVGSTRDPNARQGGASSLRIQESDLVRRQRRTSADRRVGLVARHQVADERSRGASTTSARALWGN